MYESYKQVSRCRICKAEPLAPLWDLGNHFVNGFVEPGKAFAGPKCPIEIRLCPNCGLVQNIYTAPQELLYSRQYWYRSGVTDTMRTALKDVHDAAVKELDSRDRVPGDIVLDIGSNDGTFLRNFSDFWNKIGFEPASNLAEEGSKGGINLVNDFWSYDAYAKAAPRFGRNLSQVQKATIITALGMFYDLDDPNQFIADIAQALAPDGVFIAQLMCLDDMIQVRDLGNFAHEHLEFYSMSSLDYLMNRHGLEIYKIETNSVNGQSSRLYIQHRGGPRPTCVSVPKRRALEQDIIYQFNNFVMDCEQIRSKLHHLFYQIGQAGKRIAVYGASTKGNTILQYLNQSSRFEFAAERSPEKFGLVTAGSNIPIVSEEEARQRRPDYFFVLPYAFIEEFVKRELEWLKMGGVFIVPFPVPRTIKMVDGQLYMESL